MPRETRKKMMRWKSVLARLPMMPSATLPMLAPRARALRTRAPKSWTQPMSSAPMTTQVSAGTQPQMTATAGPRTGERPAMEA
jgi:hypothetical protein